MSIATNDGVTVTILLFGRARELAGSQSVQIIVPKPATVESAFDVLRRAHPKLGDMERSLLFAINEEYASRTDSLSDGDCLAVLPPVSGGSGNDVIVITREPIDIIGLRAQLLTGEAGAVVIFDGVARNNTKGRRTLYLEYEGYAEMALRTMAQIAGEVHERWPISRVGIIHRLGRIEISESSVVIVVTSPHRKAAFEACHYAIDRLKKIVPIWKKEYFADGAVWVEGEDRCDAC
ncbi:MAG TPA: molybdenum cofactor biosynthesis protein MoaE [Blastocatellia bacterium]|nr:molybdenum cofactor biosynthesis protein MoaE [Blastocatellia bacterium]